MIKAIEWSGSKNLYQTGLLECPRHAAIIEMVMVETGPWNLTYRSGLTDWI